MADEKIIQKSGIERQTEILAAALEKAQTNGGVLLNASQKSYPRLFDKGMIVSPANALIMAIHSDNGEFKTNSYTLFNRTQQRGEAIRRGQKGVPFTWINNEYASKENPEEKISKAEYHKLPEEDKAKYQVSPKQETYTLFNIDQSTMPSVHKDEYEAQVEKYGGKEQPEAYMSAEDRQLRTDVNQFILNVRDNLVPIRKDATGISLYDVNKDAVIIPSQKTFESYNDYVQETARLVAMATGSPQRLGREGFNRHDGKTPSLKAQTKEILTHELVSAVKMLDFGLPAKLRDETLRSTVPNALQFMKEDPKFTEELLRDVNRTVGMIKKAESGEKIKLIEPAETPQQKWDKHFPMDNVPEQFHGVVMLKDDDGKWTLTAKAENEPRFAIHPTYEDVSLFFDVIKNDQDEAHVKEFRTQIAQKYYQELAKDPSKSVDLFKSNASKEALDLISKVNAFKSKDSKVYLVATIANERQQPVELSAELWQRLYLADNKRDYKPHLAAILYPEVLAAKLEEVKQATSVKVDGTPQHEEKEHEDYHRDLELEADKKKLEEMKRQNSPEQKEKEKQEEKAKEEATKAETKAVAAIALSPMVKQFIDLKKKHPDALLLFRCGDFYETYKEDAEKASKILGITLTKSTKTKDEKGKPLAMAGFPYHALDTYLPKLIRAGQRVAICDQIEAPKETTKRGITDMVSPGEKQEVKQEETKAKTEEQTQHHGVHR